MPYVDVAENTLLTISQAVAEFLSLPVPIDPAGSSDPNIRLMVRSVNLALHEMLNGYEWPVLLREGEITVVSDVVLSPGPGPSPGPSVGTYSESGYDDGGYDEGSVTTLPGPPVGPPVQASTTLGFDLPDDFFRFIDQTQWNRSMRFPAVGPVSPQTWMTYRVYPITANFTLTWQMREGQIWFLNPPPAPGHVFRFMYLSKSVVRDGDNAAVTKNKVQKNSDAVLLDPLLVALVARVKWLEAKGFDTTAATRDMILMWDTRTGADKGANILNMAGRGGGYPYISTGNLPDSSLYGMRQN